jgi:phosphoribosylformimino-5-aminoimidazole carboxamide ribotide isomerase
MLIIPVIDIQNGKCVKVVEGHGTTSEYYKDSPVKIAKLFRKENFKAIHITDLDGVKSGKMENYEVIKEISKSVDIPIQLGGGIRSYETAARVIQDLGIYRIVIGTIAISNPDLVKKIINDFSSSKVLIGIDEKLNTIVTHGWVEQMKMTPVEFALKVEELGVKRIIYQDVTRVGNLCGPHISRLLELTEKTNLKITSAGGICDYRDLKILAELNKPNIDSVLVSRALYENKFPCQMIWRDLEKEDISLELPEV